MQDAYNLPASYISSTSGTSLFLPLVRPPLQVSKALAQGVVVAPLSLAAAVAWSLVFHAVFLALNAAAATVSTRVCT